MTATLEISMKQQNNIFSVKCIQKCGKTLISPALKHSSKCGLILGMSNIKSEGLSSNTRHVANATAKMPQSLPFICCCTGMTSMPTKLSGSRSLTCCSTSSSIMSLYRLSYKLTHPDVQPIELMHTQCELPVCKI